MSEIREPKKVNSIEKKKRIIEAGLKAFGEQGYYNTTTVEIAKLAGVSTGIVYSYFKDKKDILLHALRLYFEKVFRPMEDLLKAAKPPLDIQMTIREFIRTAIASHENNFAPHEEMLAMSHLDEDVHRLFMETEKEITDTIADFLKSNGISPPHLEEKTHIAYNLAETLCHEYVYHRHEYIDYAEMIEETVNILTAMFSIG